jgi:uncharacterized cupin superfamily protein
MPSGKNVRKACLAISVNIRVRGPGQPSAVYHEESAQEDFLVLAGECLAILDGQVRRLGAWDFLHCPAGTPHVFVGAGDGPCAILMVGSRHPGKKITYWPNEVAARYGASAAQPTSAPGEAYADWGSFTPTRLSWPPASLLR